MRQIGRTIIWVAIAAGLAACARTEPGTTATSDAPLDEALQRDLALAAGEGVALAERSYEPTRFVSAIEGGPAAAPRAPRAAPRPQPRRRPAPTPRPTPEAEEVAEVAQAEMEEVETAEVGTSEAVEEAAPAPAPAAEPARAPAASGTGERRGGGVGVGTVIGVIGAVLRGGSVSGGVDDDCELHHPRRGRSGDPRVFGGPRIGGTFGGAIATGRVNDRVPPVRGPGIGQGTFPRY